MVPLRRERRERRGAGERRRGAEGATSICPGVPEKPVEAIIIPTDIAPAQKEDQADQVIVDSQSLVFLSCLDGIVNHL